MSEFRMECYVCAMWMRITGQFVNPDCEACKGTRMLPPPQSKPEPEPDDLDPQGL
jgi:hypothetical protein